MVVPVQDPNSPSPCSFSASELCRGLQSEFAGCSQEPHDFLLWSVRNNIFFLLFLTEVFLCFIFPVAVPLCWALPDPLSLPHFLACIQNLLPMSTALVCQCPKAGQPSLSLRAVHEGQTRVFILPASRLQHWQKGPLQGVGRGPVSCYRAPLPVHQPAHLFLLY